MRKIFDVHLWKKKFFFFSSPFNAYREVGRSWLNLGVFLIHLFITCKYHLMALNLRHPANGLCNKYNTVSGKSADTKKNGIWKQTTSPIQQTIWNGAKLFRKVFAHSVRFQTRFHDNWSRCIKSIRTSDFGSEVRIWLKCLLAKVLRKCHLAAMTYDTILYGGYSELCQTSTKGAPFQKELTVYGQRLLWKKHHLILDVWEGSEKFSVIINLEILYLLISC